MNATATVNLDEARTSEPFLAIATIAGAKAHRITARTLLEDAETEQFVRMGYKGGQWTEITKTTTLPEGTTLYFYTACGTTRSAGNWRVYRNDYRPADEVTCTKCLKAEAKAAAK